MVNGNMRSGAEQAFSQEAMFVHIITSDPRKGPDAMPEQTHKINYNSHRARKWLASHVRFAMETGLAIHLAPCDAVGG